VPDLISLQSTAPLLRVGLRIAGQRYSPAGARFFGQLQPQNERVESLLLSLKWINVQATLLDICIAFHPLDLPPYVVLEIVDKFPFWSTHVNHKKKIDYIIQIKRFCDHLNDARK
jgi:hypothetical protein